MSCLTILTKYQVDVSPRQFSLEEVPEAHAYIEGKTGFGKVVIINENGEKHDEKIEHESTRSFTD